MRIWLVILMPHKNITFLKNGFLKNGFFSLKNGFETEDNQSKCKKINRQTRVKIRRFHQSAFLDLRLPRRLAHLLLKQRSGSCQTPLRIQAEKVGKCFLPCICQANQTLKKLATVFERIFAAHRYPYLWLGFERVVGDQLLDHRKVT